MSWYSKIYIYVREFRSRNSICGFILHLCLNMMLLLQIIVLVCGYYVYTFIFLPEFIQNPIQATVYCVLFHSFLFMFLWSLAMTIFTSVLKVPKIYYADEETDKRLKDCTPKTGDIYYPDHSTPEEVAKQIKILESFANARSLVFVEVDEHGRLRYCYQCCLLKPDRAHHCSSCGFCVVKFDHHCPWINQCVSFANYKYFLLYLIYGEVLICFGFLTQLEAIYSFTREKNKDFLICINFSFVVLSLLLYFVLAYYHLGELLIYHLKLLLKNETTCDQVKYPIIRGDSRANYNFGRYFNCREVFGWGLWGFPVPTPVTDGMHYRVKYSENYNGDRYENLEMNRGYIFNRGGAPWSTTVYPPPCYHVSLYGSAFAISQSPAAIQCIFRYFVIFKKRTIPHYYFHITYVVIICILFPGAYWNTKSYDIVDNMPEAKSVFKSLHNWNEIPNASSTFCAIKILSAPSIFFTSCLSLVSNSYIVIIVFTSFQIHRYLTKNKAQMSPKTASMHQDLSRRLIFQTIVPGYSGLNALLLTVLSFLIKDYEGGMFQYVFITYPWIPVVNTLATLFCIKSYRIGVLNIFSKATGQSTVIDNASTTRHIFVTISQRAIR